jgi:predicted acyltransferase
VWTTGILAALSLLVWRLAQPPLDPFDRLTFKLVGYGNALLLVGLLLEPLGGGIRKDPATFSYFIVSSGLAFLFLASLTIISRSFRTGKGWRLVADTGTNPILGYLVITNLVWGIVGLTGLEALINSLTENPWLILLYAGVKTVFVALVTAWFTRRRIFLRA